MFDSSTAVRMKSGKASGLLSPRPSAFEDNTIPSSVPTLRPATSRITPDAVPATRESSFRISENASRRNSTTFWPKYSTSPTSSLNLIEFNELIKRRSPFEEYRPRKPLNLTSPFLIECFERSRNLSKPFRHGILRHRKEEN